MVQKEQNIGFTVKLDTDFETALEMVTTALKQEGFGILTEIDVKETLKEKLDVDYRPYKILGACNPPLAYKALETRAEIGLLLPCNVTVSQEEEGSISISLVDPMVMLNVTHFKDLQPIAREAQERLMRVAESLKTKQPVST